MAGYEVVVEGDDSSGYSAYSPDVPGVIAAGDTREETEALMRDAMTAHLTLLLEMREDVPQPTTDAGSC